MWGQAAHLGGGGQAAGRMLMRVKDRGPAATPGFLAGGSGWLPVHLWAWAARRGSGGGETSNTEPWVT